MTDRSKLHDWGISVTPRLAASRRAGVWTHRADPPMTDDDVIRAAQFEYDNVSNHTELVKDLLEFYIAKRDAQKKAPKEPAT